MQLFFCLSTYIYTTKFAPGKPLNFQGKREKPAGLGAGDILKFLYFVLEERTYVRYNKTTMKIMHIDANSAYLSWSAAAALEKGARIDYRTIPAVVGGSQASRHGIVLAKSIPAKKYGIKTGEPLVDARKKCPNLLVIPPDYDLYMDCSNEMYRILSRYSGIIQRYSVDECFLDYTASESRFGDPVKTADRIREEIHRELGFTVNVGVSTNKILAKMGSELKKPDKTHTLWPEEIEEKLWPLPCGELFMVGGATERKLKSLGINTIGELARADREFVKGILKSHGDLVWRYANGIDKEPVVPNELVVQKGVGNSMTIKYDVTNPQEAKAYLLSLAERVAMRLRRLNCMASRVSLWIRTFQLTGYRHQVQLDYYTDITEEIYDTACLLFDRLWRGEPIRQLGIGTGNLSYTDQTQLNFFSRKDSEAMRRADRAVDCIRDRFGTGAIFRATFANTPLRPVEGGVNDGNFLNMGGYGP